jgi:bisphosphoglycerate-dependent phosphoglycerate mutase
MGLFDIFSNKPSSSGEENSSGQENRLSIQEQTYNKPEEYTFLFFGHQNRFNTSLIRVMKDLESTTSPDVLSLNDIYKNSIDMEEDIIENNEQLGENNEQPGENNEQPGENNEQSIDSAKSTKPKKIRFSNGAILSLVIEPTVNSNNKLTFSLFHTGDGTENKPGKKYYVEDGTAGNDELKINMKPVELTVSNDAVKQHLHIEVDITNPIKCYFVRHGIAEHNEKKYIPNIKTNTSLLEKGYSGIETSGAKFGEKVKKVDAIFLSDLVRTHETAGIFLSKTNLPIINDLIIKNTPIFVLPCLHELASKQKDGESSHSIIPGVQNENKTTCRNTNKAFIHKSCNSITVSEKKIPIPINWTLYQDFYKGYRGQVIKTGFREHCHNTHFIGYVLNNLKHILPKQLVSGGKKKRTMRKKIRKNRTRKH